MSVAAPERKRSRRASLTGLSLAAVLGLVLVGLAPAARNPDSGLVRATERNTRAMLEGLIRGLGFERVAVRFG